MKGSKSMRKILIIFLILTIGIIGKVESEQAQQESQFYIKTYGYDYSQN